MIKVLELGKVVNVVNPIDNDIRKKLEKYYKKIEALEKLLEQ